MTLKPVERRSANASMRRHAEEIGRLLDERAALARDPKRKKFTLKQIAARHNVKL